MAGTAGGVRGQKWGVVDLVPLSASPIEATRNHQQYGCWRSAPMPLDAPVTSATGRVELATETNPQVMNSLAMIPFVARTH